MKLLLSTLSTKPAVAVFAVAIFVTFIPKANSKNVKSFQGGEEVTQGEEAEVRWKSYYYEVQRGETLYSLLQQSGFSDREISDFIKESGLSENFFLEIGQTYLEKRRPGHTELLLFQNESNQAHVFTKKVGEKSRSVSTYHIQKQPLRTEVHEAKGQMVGSILGSLQKVVPDRFIGLRFLDAFVLDFHLVSEVQRGARFIIRYEKKMLGPNIIRYGELLYAELEISGHTYKRYFIPLARGGVFVGENLHDQRPLFAPVDYIHISSLFQKNRYHPIYKRVMPHRGVDFVAATGTPVYSVASGVVEKRGYSRSAGYYVSVKHEGGLSSHYNHLHRISENISLGEFLPAGVQLGKVGCTGLCTKAHLHFAVKRGGEFINPIGLLKNHSFFQKNHLEREFAKLH